MDTFCKCDVSVGKCSMCLIDNTKEGIKMTNNNVQPKEDLKIGFSWEPKSKEVIVEEGRLVRFKSYVTFGLTFLGVITKVTDTQIKVMYKECTHPITISRDRVIDSWEVVIHKPEKKLPTKPYEQLVSYKSWTDGELVWGVFSKVDYNHDGDPMYYAHFSCNHKGHEGFLYERHIEDVVDIIVHEPKEDNLSALQEAANFGYQAVQGIINAHNEKNRETLEECNCYSNGSFSKCCGRDFTLSDFDNSVKRTWKNQDSKDAISNAALGLTGEAGEVADLIKKAIYHGRGFIPEGILPSVDVKSIRYEQVKDELSDVLYYVSAMAQEFGYSLEDVAKHNKAKLEKRYENGFTVEESANKKDKIKPEGKIILSHNSSLGEDTLEYNDVVNAPFSKTFFNVSHNLRKTLEELKDGKRVTIEDLHHGEFKFTRVGSLVRVHFKDLDNHLESHNCLVTVSYKGEN